MKCNVRAILSMIPILGLMNMALLFDISAQEAMRMGWQHSELVVSAFGRINRQLYLYTLDWRATEKEYQLARWSVPPAGKPFLATMKLSDDLITLWPLTNRLATPHWNIRPIVFVIAIGGLTNGYEIALDLERRTVLFQLELDPKEEHVPYNSFGLLGESVLLVADTSRLPCRGMAYAIATEKDGKWMLTHSRLDLPIRQLLGADMVDNTVRVFYIPFTDEKQLGPVSVRMCELDPRTSKVLRDKPFIENVLSPILIFPTNKKEIWLFADGTLSSYERSSLKLLKASKIAGAPVAKPLGKQEDRPQVVVSRLAATDNESRYLAFFPDVREGLWVIDVVQGKVVFSDTNHALRIEKFFQKNHHNVFAAAHVMIQDLAFVEGADLLAAVVGTGQLYLFDVKEGRRPRTYYLSAIAKPFDELVRP